MHRISKQSQYFRHCLGKSRFFRFRQAAFSLMGTSKQSLPQEDPDGVMVDSPRPPEDSLALTSLPSPSKDSPTDANDTHALISPSHRSSQVSVTAPLDHSSPKHPWDRLYQTEQHQSTTCLAATNTFPQGSVGGMRRASSVHDVEGFSSNTKALFRDRHQSEGRRSLTLTGLTQREGRRSLTLTGLTLQLC